MDETNKVFEFERRRVIYETAQADIEKACYEAVVGLLKEKKKVKLNHYVSFDFFTEDLGTREFEAESISCEGIYIIVCDKVGNEFDFCELRTETQIEIVNDMIDSIKGEK